MQMNVSAVFGSTLQQLLHQCTSQCATVFEKKTNYAESGFIITVIQMISF